MKPNKGFYAILGISTLLVGALACGGGGGGSGNGGGGGDFVTGLWNLSGTTTPGTSSPGACQQVANEVGPVEPFGIDAARQDGTANGIEAPLPDGSFFLGGSEPEVWNGTVDDANQSFTLTDAVPTCEPVVGTCQVCLIANVDFLNVVNNTAAVNFQVVATGNSSCPSTLRQGCTITYSMGATRS